MRDSIVAARISGPDREADGAVAYEFRFGAGDPTFAGHFPRRPLLPGVFQLEMARLAAEWILDLPLSVREIRKAKFQRPILPAEIVRVRVTCSESGNMIRARAGFSVAGEPAGETMMTLCRNA